MNNNQYIFLFFLYIIFLLNKNMKWVELKNYLAPTFMKEIDRVCEIYISKI